MFRDTADLVKLQVESVEDGDTLLVASGQHGTGNRYRDNIIECNIRLLWKSSGRHELFQ